MRDVKIKKLLLDHRELHSNFQIDNFIVGSQGDKWAQYKQCLREISSRVGMIRQKKAEAQLLKLDMARQRFFWPSKYNIGRRKIEREEKQARLDAMHDILSEYERELTRFLKHAVELKKYFGNIDEDARQRFELKSWTAKARKMAAIDKILTGRISHKTFEFILALPPESQNAILDDGLKNEIRAITNE